MEISSWHRKAQPVDDPEDARQAYLLRKAMEQAADDVGEEDAVERSGVVNGREAQAPGSRFAQYKMLEANEHSSVSEGGLGDDVIN